MGKSHPKASPKPAIPTLNDDEREIRTFKAIAIALRLYDRNGKPARYVVRHKIRKGYLKVDWEGTRPRTTLRKLRQQLSGAAALALAAAIVLAAPAPSHAGDGTTVARLSLQQSLEVLR
jgi:hypothetical protein